ncbi:hypothetical protein BKA70DRAFT_1239553 [Coprinopsis sp. MPI-PUGE-AT-0042]|nr:hypothetical protein BKA70DRAFT_1239553 [Coprinopsis sp. MPI-PUGE-AT-0042]
MENGQYFEEIWIKWCSTVFSIITKHCEKSWATFAAKLMQVAWLLRFQDKLWAYHTQHFSKTLSNYEALEGSNKSGLKVRARVEDAWEGSAIPKQFGLRGGQKRIQSWLSGRTCNLRLRERGTERGIGPDRALLDGRLRNRGNLASKPNSVFGLVNYGSREHGTKRGIGPDRALPHGSALESREFGIKSEVGLGDTGSGSNSDSALGYWLEVGSQDLG